jgi:DNA-binding NtrC family response regulator
MNNNFSLTERAAGAANTEAVGKQLSNAARKRVLVFSPDSDLAKVLLLNLEDKFQIVREHCLEKFEEGIRQIEPELILVDLFTFPDDIIKQIGVIKRTSVNVPIIALRAYMSLTPEINASIDEFADVLFYKPVDVELVTQAIESFLK